MKVTYVAVFYKHNPDLEGQYFFVDFDFHEFRELLPPVEMLEAEDCLGFILAKYKELNHPLPPSTPINQIFMEDAVLYEIREITIELNDYAGTKKRPPKKFIPKELYRFAMSEQEKFRRQRERDWQKKALEELKNVEGEHVGFMSGRPWLPRGDETIYVEDENSI
ncbi:hypothetical protein AMC75_08440 [Staphylococcus carnosus]|uniref:hypothetical protein n=1 Tax=Staphylococcus carnosus TaxID=1281 RepID=UPI0006AB8B44|nr:hypothetical protein [Staphylococcus carnosus]KOR12503.1 hypothetical protein AMC75_08440 [Staphylococcus carnosus]